MGKEALSLCLWQNDGSSSSLSLRTSLWQICVLGEWREKCVPELGYWKPGSVWGVRLAWVLQVRKQAFFSHNLKNIYVLGKELYEGEELSLLASDETGSPEQCAKQFPIVVVGYASHKGASLGCDSCVETEKLAFLRFWEEQGKELDREKLGFFRIRVVEGIVPTPLARWEGRCSHTAVCWAELALEVSGVN